MVALLNQQCSQEKINALSPQEFNHYLPEIHPWEVNHNQNLIHRQFKLKDYDQTLRFVNQVAKLAIEEDHHPEITFGYNFCKVEYTTHASSSLSLNDLICAAKINQIFLAYE